MRLMTGYGYYIDSKGRKLHKFELPIGQHPDPQGFTIVEVPTKADLDKIVLDKSDEQIAFEAQQKKKSDLIASGNAKLKALGLTDEEIAARMG